MPPLVFVLPLPPNLANGRLHWRAKDRKRREYFEACDVRELTKQLPRKPVAPLAPVRLDILLYVPQRMDDDNALARIKWCADFLKTRGYIRDDKQPHCRFTIPTQIVKRDGNNRVELTVTQL